MKSIIYIAIFLFSFAFELQAAAPAKTGFATITFHKASFEHSGRAKEKGAKMRWTVNGKEFGYQEDTIVVTAHNGLDTIVFFDGGNSTDTMFCDLRKNKSYQIQFNICCGYFNMYESPKTPNNYDEQAIFFQLRKYYSDEPLLVMIGTTTLPITRSSPTQVLHKDVYGSAMDPSVKTIQIAMQDSNELVTVEGEEYFSHYTNKSYILMHFKYIFLHKDQLEVNYNARDNEWELKLTK